MHRMILIITGLLVALGANADPRLEVKGNFCHVLHDNVNSHNETFVADCAAFIAAEEEGKVANGYSRVVKRYVPVDVLNYVDVVGPEPITIEVCEREDQCALPFPSQHCTMVDSNNTKYASDDWSTKIVVIPTDDLAFATLIYEIKCLDGKAL